MKRVLEPEILDNLEPGDKRAIHSRRDLRIINRFMGNRAHMARVLQRISPPRKIVEFGSGDATFIAGLLEELPAGRGGPLEVYLLDRHPSHTPKTLNRIKRRGWNVSVLKSDLFEWLAAPSPAQADLIIANLFLHHFSEKDLRRIFTGCARTSDAFIACDPRRWKPADFCTRFLWLLGCNDVTRNDARVSVRAGFRGLELSPLWPTDSNFDILEEDPGWSSHVFAAFRRPALVQ